jgi:tRNA(Ile)-lysidine synthase
VHERLIAYIRRHDLMRAGNRVGVAVSGGADSVALLRLLLDVREHLGLVLGVVHFNHKLRGAESEADEQFVRDLAGSYDLEFFCDSADTRAHAATRKCGTEAAARELRYGFFQRLIQQQRLSCIATAHSLDDQAETVLLRLLRGAGTRGLAGIYPQVTQTGGSIVRPLLEFRRAQLRHYLRRSSQAWREDATNQDVSFARNRVRQEVMPKLHELNPALEQVLSETAEIAREEEDFWQQEITRRMPDCLDARGSTLDLKKLAVMPLALQRRMMRAFAERHELRLEFHHIQQVLDVAHEPVARAERRVELPQEWDACIAEQELRLEKRSQKPAGEYEYSLSVPGEVNIPAARLKIRAAHANGSRPQVSPAKVGDLRVRNWRAGDRYWPAHTNEPKKIKELLQSRRVPANVRAHWPVVVTEVDGAEQIVWVPGFEYPEQFLLTNDDGNGLTLEHVSQG